jgi:hypothetical protein
MQSRDLPEQTTAARPRFTEKRKCAMLGAEPIHHLSDQIPFNFKLRR